jgi:DUF4097 and DUF4098 domain-containing protein YvlB
MKKLALLIGILSLAVATLADNRIKSTASEAAVVIKTSCADSFQKARGDELIENFSQTYPLTPTGRVNIVNINGDVRVNVWDQNTVKVDAVKRAYSSQRLSEVTIDVQSASDILQIKTKYPEDRNYSGRNREDGWASVEYTLTLPRRAQLDGAELVNGSLDVQGVQGQVRASLVNGNVKASGLGGEVKLSTVNGAVEATVAGVEKERGGVQLSSVNGSIVLVLPDGANADVRASTVHGAITNDFGLKVEDGEYVGHSMSGQIGSGGGRIRLNNVNGSIAVRRIG